MQAIIRSTLILLLMGCLGLPGAGCGTAVRVRVDDQADFASYRTWSWRISSPSDYADLTPEQLMLVGSVARQIGFAMRSRGFRYVRSDADLLVTPELRVRRRRVIMHHAEPDQFLPSLHASPSYSIEGLTTEEVRIVDSTSLSVVVADRRSGRIVWQARLQDSFEEGFSRHVARSVAALMEPFPAATSPPADMPASGAVAQRTGGPGNPLP